MQRATALESQRLVVHGERSELRLDEGRIVVHKEATTQVAPTEVGFGIEQVRGATLEPPSRGGHGWLHLSVVGGSPPPPSGLAATGDPYTLPLTSRGAAAARKLVRMVERHVQARGMPMDKPVPGGVVSTGVVLNPAGGPSPKNPLAPATARSEQAGELVAHLRGLVELHQSGALTDEEFAQAKARILEPASGQPDR